MMQQQYEILQRPNRILHPLFDVVRGQLGIYTKIPAGKLLGFPVEPYHRLCLRRGASIKEVESLSWLGGKLKINSPKGALQFARLFTSPSTVYLSKERSQYHYIDIINRKDMDIDLFYGDNFQYKFFAKVPNGYCGIIDHNLYISMRIPKSKSEQVGALFAISRPVLRFSAVGGHIEFDHITILTQEIDMEGNVKAFTAKNFPSSSVSRIKWRLQSFK